MADNSKTIRNGMIAAGIGLLGWAATRKRGEIRQGMGAVSRRLNELVPGLRTTLASAIPTIRGGLSDLIPGPLRERLGLTASEQPAIGHLGARRALGGVAPPVLHDAVVNGFDSIDPSQWHEFGVDLVHALQTAGVHTSRLTVDLGLSTNDVYEMTPDDYGRLIAFTQQNHPDVLASLVSEREWAPGLLRLPVTH